MTDTGKRRKTEFKLVVPLDASDIEGDDQELRVVGRGLSGVVAETSVVLRPGGKAEAELVFDQNPGSLRVYVGPAETSADELVERETLTRNVKASLWANSRVAKLDAVLITPYYWLLWPRWCRMITLRGRVVCPDGRPVPGAKVCAFDVDRFWWWYSKDEVGCATTNANGEYEIRFRWCCGFGPWWWWHRRNWVLDPEMLRLLQPVLHELPKPIPVSPKIDLDVFTRALGDEIVGPAAIGVDGPGTIDAIRDRLVERLAAPPATLAWLWPWRPWKPWWDCSPDIVFTVTQDCGEGEQAVLEEGYGATRWNVSGNQSDVLTVADACCIDDDPPPEGECMVITKVCNDVVDTIGGNIGAAASPEGYHNPGSASISGDQPYAAVVPIHGIFGSGAQADYYEFEYDDGSGFTPMPPLSNGSFTRRYFDSTLVGSGTSPFQNVTFSAQTVGGRLVYMSRERYEGDNSPASWGATRWWVLNRDALTWWLTENNFVDGEYRLRVRAWELIGADQLGNDRYLPLCGSEDENYVVVRLDNRIEGVHPTAPNHPCGPGTVHGCWVEPDTDFIEVRINGVPVAPCAVIDASAGGTLEIDFLADDPDGHLANYTLIATYGENQQRNLLALSGANVMPLPSPAIVPPAVQVGPDYGDARTGAGFNGAPALPRPAAAAPTWRGGAMRYILNDLSLAFPVTCGYQFELRAYKRTIVSCNHGRPYRNLSEYTITVQV